MRSRQEIIEPIRGLRYGDPVHLSEHAADLSPADVEAFRRNIGAACADLLERLRPDMEAFAAACRALEPKLRELAAALQQLAGTALPADPMLRAIEVKKRRGQPGPARPVRAPRSLGRQR